MVDNFLKSLIACIVTHIITFKPVKTHFKKHKRSQKPKLTTLNVSKYSLLHSGCIEH